MTINLTTDDMQLAIYAIEAAAKSSEQHARNSAMEGHAVSALVAGSRGAAYRRIAQKLHEAAAEVGDDDETRPVPVMGAASYDANGAPL